MYEIQQQTQSVIKTLNQRHHVFNIIHSSSFKNGVSKHKLKRERLKPDLEQTFYFVSSI